MMVFLVVIVESGSGNDNTGDFNGNDNQGGVNGNWNGGSYNGNRNSGYGYNGNNNGQGNSGIQWFLPSNQRNKRPKSTRQPKLTSHLFTTLPRNNPSTLQSDSQRHEDNDNSRDFRPWTWSGFQFRPIDWQREAKKRGFDLPYIARNYSLFLPSHTLVNE